jgi:hypothetical protein
MDNFELLSVENYSLVGDKLKQGNLIKEIPAYNEIYKPVIFKKGE